MPVREYFVGWDQEFAEDAKAFELCDVIVTVGGDGTILHAARQSLGYNKPLLGINIGRMGFLATVEAYEMEKLERLVHGEYILDRRSILSVSVDGQNRFRQTALNDVVISKSGHLSDGRCRDFLRRHSGQPLPGRRAWSSQRPRVLPHIRFLRAARCWMLTLQDSS